MHSLVRGPTRSLFFCGDLVPGRHWLHLPITMGYDRFPERLIDEKQEIATKALSESWLLFFPHDPGYCAARCALDERDRYVATDLMHSLEQFEL